MGDLVSLNIVEGIDLELIPVQLRETIGVEAKWPDMAFNYRTTGSGNCDTIRILSLKLADLERRIVEMSENRSYTLDERDLNYNAYFSEGEQHAASLEDFHSHNAEQLSVDGVKDLLLSLPEVREELTAWQAAQA